MKHKIGLGRGRKRRETFAERDYPTPVVPGRHPDDFDRQTWKEVVDWARTEGFRQYVALRKRGVPPERIWVQIVPRRLQQVW